MDQLFSHFALFHGLACGTFDVDPTYPVLRRIGGGKSKESAYWMTFLHVAYYHLGSALKVLDAVEEPAGVPDRFLQLPCSTERRGHRDPRRLHLHLRSLLGVVERHGSFGAWLESDLPGDPVDAWRATTDKVLSVWGNGRWAAYKTCELLWKVNGLKLEAPDMGHAHSSGPRRGLELLFDGLPTGNKPADIARLDQVSRELCLRLGDLQLPYGVEEVETTLCDFKSLCHGRYYVGHDIDQMLAQLLEVVSEHGGLALDARAETLPLEYLGELNGWRGVDPVRRTVYKKTGKILTR